MGFADLKSGQRLFGLRIKKQKENLMSFSEAEKRNKDAFDEWFAIENIIQDKLLELERKESGVKNIPVPEIEEICELKQKEAILWYKSELAHYALLLTERD
jgi:hypothetical protein